MDMLRSNWIYCVLFLFLGIVIVACVSDAPIGIRVDKGQSASDSGNQCDGDDGDDDDDTDEDDDDCDSTEWSCSGSCFSSGVGDIDYTGCGTSAQEAEEQAAAECEKVYDKYDEEDHGSQTNVECERLCNACDDH
jgi:hypothetical protein